MIAKVTNSCIHVSWFDNANLCILVVYTFRALPESVFWLTANGKVKEAEEVLQKMARWNGVKVTGPLLTKKEQLLEDDKPLSGDANYEMEIKDNKPLSGDANYEMEIKDNKPLSGDTNYEMEIKDNKHLSGDANYEMETKNNTTEVVKDVQSDTGQFIDLFRDRVLLKHTIIGSLFWYVNYVLDVYKLVIA